MEAKCKITLTEVDTNTRPNEPSDETHVIWVYDGKTVDGEYKYKGVTMSYDDLLKAYRLTLVE